MNRREKKRCREKMKQLLTKATRRAEETDKVLIGLYPKWIREVSGKK